MVSSLSPRGDKLAGRELAPLQEILERCGAGAGDFYLLRGRGRILAALPRAPDAFWRTLNLYRPQKNQARLWIWFLKILHHLHLPGLALASWSWKGSPLASLPCPGVFLGNPDHRIQRAILLKEDQGFWSVGKFLADPLGQETLRREENLIQRAAENGGHAPRCLGSQPCGLGVALWMEWLDPRRGNPSRAERIQVLLDWLLPAQPRSLSLFPSWKATGGWAEGSDRQRLVAQQIQLRPCLRHGDFAPWNLLQRPNGAWVAVDWEEGCAEDAPGLDLVHDLIQEEFLLRRSSWQESRPRILRALQHADSRRYLTASGWLGHEEILVDWALAFEAHHRPEIREWRQSS